MPRKRTIESDLDALYGVPLKEFTGERNALAKRLRDAGRGEQADEVKALRKPSVPAGAINRGLRADPKAAKRLLEAGERLRSAHEDALAGGGADELRQAMAGEAEAVEEMTQAARAASRGGELGPAMLDRVRDTLRSVAGDDELRAEFEAGRVVRDRKPVGLGGAVAAAPRGRRRASAKRDPTAAERTRAGQRVTRARKALDASRSRLADAEKELNAARRTLKQAEARVADAERKRDRAQNDLDEAEAAQAKL